MHFHEAAYGVWGFTLLATVLGAGPRPASFDGRFTNRSVCFVHSTKRPSVEKRGGGGTDTHCHRKRHTRQNKRMDTKRHQTSSGINMNISFQKTKKAQKEWWEVSFWFYTVSGKILSLGARGKRIDWRRHIHHVHHNTRGSGSCSQGGGGLYMGGFSFILYLIDWTELPGQGYFKGRRIGVSTTTASPQPKHKAPVLPRATLRLRF